MKHAISTWWLANPKQGRSLFFCNSLEFTLISYSSSKWRFLCSLICHIGVPSPNHIDYWAFSPISCQHVSFWYPFLELQVTTYPLDYIGVWFKGSNWARHFYLRTPKVDAPNPVTSFKSCIDIRVAMWLGVAPRTNTKKVHHVKHV